MLTTISGDVVRAWLSWRGGMSPDASINSVILDRVVTLAAIALLVIVALPWFIAHLSFTPEAFLPSVAGVGFLVVVAVVAQLGRLPERWHHLRPVRLLHSLGTSVHQAMLRPANAVPALAAAVLAQLLLAAATYALARSLSTPVSLIDCVVLIQIVAIANAAPISVGGWGVREAAMIGLFGMVGVSPHAALLLSVQIGLLGLASNLPGGLIWLALRRGEPAAGSEKGTR